MKAALGGVLAHYHSRSCTLPRQTLIHRSANGCHVLLSTEVARHYFWL